ncbi:putative redox protein [Aquiflexum balticum DSM 16537]|uniref:Putative redox protein n=1 Tax=Aquiflexum balticum DSM 16537 TaxID=758820 RepID=A0A1W2H9E6_9BACT|nr:bifunctional alpha/beta hydrolase/OsmC family protein [Aquiflexum balticum]SMD45404.1 putative redox protein [Aquiflexum balticum DSM 16537]
MKIERLNFKNKGGYELSARLYLPLDEPPRFYAIFAHCFTCSKNFKAVSNISNTLSQLGIAVLSFDFTGLGSSEGDFEETGFSSNVDDLLAAADFLEKKYEAPKLLIGHSLGGSAVIFAAAELDYVEAVVTIGSPANPKHVKKLFESDIATIKEEGSAKVNIGGRSFRIKNDFVEDLESKNLPDLISKMRKAFLFLHSPQDQIVDISNAAELYQNAHHPKSFVSLDGADHLLSDEIESKYAGELISTWSKKYLPIEIKENDIKGHQVKVRLFGESYTSEIKTPYHHLLADEPKDVGGANLGPTPYDLLMASLGACTVMTLKMYTQRKGWDLKEIIVYLDHDKVHKEDSEDFEKKASKVSRFTRNLEIKGDLDNEKKEKLLEIANKCPVHRTLHEDIIIETKFK